jgi:flagellar hook-basal body protein
MRTGISGMNAQADRLSTVADNIANADTKGYKRASTEFSSLVLPSSDGSYNSGGVATSVRHAISAQGMLDYTTSATDLAITGSGFFVVQDSSGTPYLTRAGAFVPNQNGNLVNAAGYTLLGYPYSSGTPSTVANGLDGLEPITLNSSALTPPVPSTQGTLAVNLPADADAVGTTIIDQPPSQNAPYTSYNHKMSVVSASASGDLVYSDIYFTKLADNTWEITAFDNYSGAPTGVPYDLSSGDIKMGTTMLTFDPVTGAIVSGDPVIVTTPSDPVYLDFSNITQAGGGGGSPMSMQLNMNLPSDDPILDTSAGELPASSNDPAAVYNKMLEMSGYAGANVDLDVYFTRTGADTWEAAAYDASTASGGGFPYGSPALATSTLAFDPATGNLISGGDMTVPLPGGGTWPLDLTDTVSMSDFTPGLDEGAHLSFNLSPTEPVVQPHIGATTPATNQPNSTYTEKTSLVAVDNLGSEVLLDIYYTKGPDNEWEVTVFDRADASANGFPYANPPLASTLMEFDPTNGTPVDGSSITLTVPGGSELTLDLSKTTQLGTGFSVQDAKLNGHAPSMAAGFQISEDGTVYAQYDNGDLEPIFRLAMADVASPDQLQPLSGNVFETTSDSGNVHVGFAGSGGFGTITSGALENSNVDIAEELTDMITAQRSYTANSKVFQTGSELMDVLINLKR